MDKKGRPAFVGEDDKIYYKNVTANETHPWSKLEGDCTERPLFSTNNSLFKVGCERSVEDGRTITDVYVYDYLSAKFFEMEPAEELRPISTTIDLNGDPWVWSNIN